jgi:hypothetical protein
MEIVQQNPTLILDVSHNKQGIEATLKSLNLTENAKLTILLGASQDKATEEMLSLFPKNTEIHLCTFKNERSQSFERLQEIKMNNSKIEFVQAYSANPFSRRETLSVMSNTLSIEVKAFKNEPPTFNGAVGKYEMFATLEKTGINSDDFLNVGKFPTATFKATTIKLTGKRTADITGDLTLRGVTKPVTVAATFNQAGVNPVDRTYSLGFAGKAKIKRTDFGVSAYAPALGDEVTLELEAELKKIG